MRFAAAATSSELITSPKSRACFDISLKPSEPADIIGMRLRPPSPKAAIAIRVRSAGSSFRLIASAKSSNTSATGRILPPASLTAIPSALKSVAAELVVSLPDAISAMCFERSLSPSSSACGDAPACLAANDHSCSVSAESPTRAAILSTASPAAANPVTASLTLIPSDAAIPANGPAIFTAASAAESTVFLRLRLKSRSRFCRFRNSVESTVFRNPSQRDETALMAGLIVSRTDKSAVRRKSLPAIFKFSLDAIPLFGILAQFFGR